MEVVGGAFFVALWAASVVWTVRDVRRRCSDPSLRVVSAGAAFLLPFVGAGLYALLRPCEERLDVKARRLRMRMLEGGFIETATRCVACRCPVEPDFLCCPRCGESLRRECEGCGGLVRLTWTACPWCTKPLEVPGEARLSEVA